MPKKKRKRKKPRSGAPFEREICRDLSLWISEGKRDDYFWRTSISGGRATVRSRKGKQTHGQYGDIHSTHPKSSKLMQVAVFEIKVGYSRNTPHDIIDAPTRKGKVVDQMYAKWIKQARRSMRQADAKTWFIVHRRNGRKASVMMPHIDAIDYNLTMDPNSAVYFIRLAKNNPPIEVFTCQWDYFLANVNHKHVEGLL